MRVLFVIALFVGITAAKWQAWKAGTQYKYELRGRTVAGLHQVSNQFSGILIKGQVTVQPYGDNTLSVKVAQAEYADLHANLSSGWSTYIPDGKLSYKQLPLSSKPFELKLKNGVVEKLIVDKSLPTWEVNMLKGIASQLQVDTQAENLQESRINHLPADKDQAMGVYKTMEDSVTGECETIYDISPLPTYVIQSKPMLAPLPHLRGEGQLIDIMKTKNFSNCDQRMAYHFGISGFTDWEPASTQMGNLISRASVQRVVASGSLDRYTIQSSVTTNKIIIAPHLHNAQKGIVASRMNLTLESVSSASGTPQTLSNPRILKNLVYDYNAATQDEKSHKYQEHNSNDSSSSSSSSSSSCSDSGNDGNKSQCSNSQDSSNSQSSDSSESSSSSSSENDANTQKRYNRTRRSVINSRKRQQESNGSRSSSSSNSITNSSSSSQSTYPSSSSSDSDISTSTRSSWDSTKEYMQRKPSLFQAPNSPFLPFFVGYKGNSIQASDQINGVKAVQKLAQQIADELQTPNAITGQQTLTTFNIMARVMRTMNAQQIEEVGNQLYFPKTKADPKSKSDAQKYLVWVTFRDAVAQAGTGPALVTLKKWIQNHKVQGEVAAELISVLPDTARYPTEEYMNALFELATDSEVRMQRYLNTTAIHVFTNLIRKVQVNNETTHNTYPVHSFGRPISKKAQQAIYNKYIPFLVEQLKSAIQSGDSHKIQVYIRALGNTAHPQIIRVFEPYIEGNDAASKFQRFYMVACMDHISKIYPKLMRPILYNIYQNTGEVPEIRIAAIMHLMKTNPPAEMLQRMAQFTNNEHNKQVNSIVKSVIESAAKLKDPRYKELARNAQSAVNLLISKHYGFQYSKNYMWSYMDESEKWGYMLSMGSIQNKDSVIPSSLSYRLRKNIGGLTYYSYLASMTSSSKKLMDLFRDVFIQNQSQRNGHENNKKDEKPSSRQWTTDKIANMLNIETDDADQVEGNVMISWAGGQRFFAFDNHTIEQLPSIVKEAASSLQNGQHFNYTKLTNQFTIEIGFPTAMGLPFVYSLQVPTVLSIGGEAKLKTHPELASGPNDEIRPPQSLNLTAEIKMIYASKTESKLGFVTPFNHQHYLAGYDSNTQIHIPLRVKVDVDVKNTQVWANIQPLHPDKYQKIFESSSSAYTTRYNILDLSAPQHDENAEIIHIRTVKRFEVISGQQSTGFSFDIKGETEEKHFDLPHIIKSAQRLNFPTIMHYYNKKQSIKPNTNYTITYNPDKTTAQSSNLYINYDHTMNNENNESDDLKRNAAIPPTGTNVSKWNKQFLERAAVGITNATTQAMSISLEFQGQSNVQFIATAAYSRSPVSEKSRYLLLLAKNPEGATKDNTIPYQIAVDVMSKTPRVPLLDFKKAIGMDPSSNMTIKINFGGKAETGGEIQIQTAQQQTSEYKENLQQDGMASECAKQMSQGNNILPECRNVTARANFLNHYTLSAGFNKVPESLQNFTYNVYSAIRDWGYPYLSENIVDHGNPNGKLNLNINFSHDLSSANVSIESPLLSSEFTNLRVGPLARALAVPHPEYDTVERIGQWGLLSQQFPSCAVDKTFATTFDNKTYPISIGKCWHVLMNAAPQSANNPPGNPSSENYNKVSILVHDIDSNKREVMIILNEDVVTLSSLEYIEANEKKYDLAVENLTSIEDKFGSIIVKAHKMSSGDVRIITPKHGFEIMYDGLRIKLQAPNGYRGDVRGLCGTFDGEKFNDFTSPKNCILDSPSEFVRSYAIRDESCQESSELQKSACFKETYMPGDVISNHETSNQYHHSQAMNPQPKQLKRSKNNKLISEKFRFPGCDMKRIIIINRAGRKCFSKKPQLTCLGNCNNGGRIPMNVDFYCLPEGREAKNLAFLVSSGVKNLTFNETSMTEQVWLPKSCSPR